MQPLYVDLVKTYKENYLVAYGNPKCLNLVTSNLMLDVYFVEVSTLQRSQEMGHWSSSVFAYLVIHLDKVVRQVRYLYENQNLVAMKKAFHNLITLV